MRFLSILLILNIVSPPSPGGVYLTAEQFSQHTLSYPFDCRTGKLRLNSFLGGAGIQVINNGEKHSFAKDTIFGYRDCKGFDYRFYQNAPYRILDTTGFFLYSYTRLEQGSKIARPATAYYFSSRPTASIQPLTITNLQKAFSSNPNFCYRLSAEFHTDADLLSWFAAGNTYKIKYAYRQSTL
jgi:hypothetical protein